MSRSFAADERVLEAIALASDLSSERELGLYSWMAIEAFGLIGSG
jgi:hypothetical protein